MLTVNAMDRAYLSIKVTHTKENGLQICHMVMVVKFFLMVIGLKDVIDKVNALEMEFIFGEMAHINVLKEFSRVIYHLKRDNYQ